MKIILLLAISCLGLLSCSQSAQTGKPKLTAEFFYGAWGDSLYQQNGGKGVIFGDENDFYIIWDGNISGGETFEQNLRLTYELHLDDDPIKAEITSRYVDTDSVDTTIFATIEVIDSTHLTWKLFDESGNTVDSARLTRASNK